VNSPPQTNAFWQIGIDMLLNTKERLILIATLPKEGDYTTLKIVRKLREDLSFTEEEHKALKFVDDPNGMIHWEPSGDKPVAIDIGEKAKDIITTALRKLDSEKRLTEDHIELYEKFIKE
jgi:hypothetical protein